MSVYGATIWGVGLEQDVDLVGVGGSVAAVHEVEEFADGVGAEAGLEEEEEDVILVVLNW